MVSLSSDSFVWWEFECKVVTCVILNRVVHLYQNCSHLSNAPIDDYDQELERVLDDIACFWPLFHHLTAVCGGI